MGVTLRFLRFVCVSFRRGQERSLESKIEDGGERVNVSVNVVNHSTLASIPFVPHLCHHSINSSFSHRVSNLGSDDAQSVYPSPANDTSARRLDGCQPTSYTTCTASSTSRNHAFTGHAFYYMWSLLSLH